MKVLNVRNVNEALPDGMELLWDNWVLEESRAGPVLVYPSPVTTVYERPLERVLFSPARDANPFFHLFEALWMLAGRNDGQWLDQFVHDFSARFGEQDGTIHGAYGYRWREAFGLDQLNYIAHILKTDPTSRQCVLQMWDARDPSCYVGECCGMDDLGKNWKDRPCNTHVYFRVRNASGSVYDYPSDVGIAYNQVLDITVCCRSNDIIWGAYGANAVHFSVLQEYMAARIGVGVGRYYQISNNYHAYADMFKKIGNRVLAETPFEGYPAGVTPIVTVPDDFDRDLQMFFRGNMDVSYSNLFFPEVAWPLFQANLMRKDPDRKRLADMWVSRLPECDWKVAATAWLERRKK